MKEELTKNEKSKLKKIKIQLKKSAAKHAKQARQATDIAKASEKSSELHNQQVDVIDKMLDEKKKKRKKRKKAGTESSKESSLRDWFKRKGAPGKKGGWVDCNTCRKGKCKPCGRKKGEKRAKYPSCRPTPAACKERGRGKTWGKKSKKSMKESFERIKELVREELTN